MYQPKLIGVAVVVLLGVFTLQASGHGTWSDSDAYVYPSPASSLSSVQVCNYNYNTTRTWGNIYNSSGVVVGTFDFSFRGCTYPSWNYGSLPNGGYIAVWNVEWYDGHTQYGIDSDSWILQQ